MIPVQFAEANAVLARDQGEYEPLPVFVFIGDPEGKIAFCCRLSDAEIEEIRRTRTLWFQQLTFGRPFQPVALSTDKPDITAVGHGGRRRAVRERMERKLARESGMAAFDASLARLKEVIDNAIAEGLKTLTAEELSRRLAALDSSGEASK